MPDMATKQIWQTGRTPTALFPRRKRSSKLNIYFWCCPKTLCFLWRRSVRLDMSRPCLLKNWKQWAPHLFYINANIFRMFIFYICFQCSKSPSRVWRSLHRCIRRHSDRAERMVRDKPVKFYDVEVRRYLVRNLVVIVIIYLYSWISANAIPDMERNFEV